MGERREWYITRGESRKDGKYNLFSVAGGDHVPGPYERVTAVELKPGEIVLSREELRRAWEKAHELFYVPCCADIEAALFDTLNE